MESPVSPLLTAGGGRLNDPVMFGCYQGGLLWGWSVRERNWERLIQSSIKTESSQYLPALGDIKSAAEPGRPMTDKPKVNTDCNGRGEGRGRKIVLYFLSLSSESIFNPSLKFTDFRSEYKKFKTNANCSNKLSFEVLEYMTG